VVKPWKQGIFKERGGLQRPQHGDESGAHVFVWFGVYLYGALMLPHASLPTKNSDMRLLSSTGDPGSRRGPFRSLPGSLHPR